MSPAKSQIFDNLHPFISKSFPEWRAKLALLQISSFSLCLMSGYLSLPTSPWSSCCGRPRCKYGTRCERRQCQRQSLTGLLSTKSSTSWLTSSKLLLYSLWYSEWLCCRFSLESRLDGQGRHHGLFSLLLARLLHGLRVDLDHGCLVLLEQEPAPPTCDEDKEVDWWRPWWCSWQRCAWSSEEREKDLWDEGKYEKPTNGKEPEQPAQTKRSFEQLWETKRQQGQTIYRKSPWDRDFWNNEKWCKTTRSQLLEIKSETVYLISSLAFSKDWIPLTILFWHSKYP